jgi:uncharacterized protein (DUF433 family)
MDTTRPEEALLARVASDPRVMTGKPVIKGTRLTVAYILGLLAHGMTPEAILEEYPGLERADIAACLLFAERSLESTSYFPLTAQSA